MEVGFVIGEKGGESTQVTDRLCQSLGDGSCCMVELDKGRRVHWYNRGWE